MGDEWFNSVVFRKTTKEVYRSDIAASDQRDPVFRSRTQERTPTADAVGNLKVHETQQRRSDLGCRGDGFGPPSVKAVSLYFAIFCR